MLMKHFAWKTRGRQIWQSETLNFSRSSRRDKPSSRLITKNCFSSYSKRLKIGLGLLQDHCKNLLRLRILKLQLLMKRRRRQRL